MIVAEVSAAVFAAHLARVASGGLAAELAEHAAVVADRLEDQVRDNISARLTMRSRQLLTSVRGDLVQTPELLTVTISAGGDAEGLGVAYARIQELGGIVRPVRGKFLAIPTEAAKLGPGIARAPSPRLIPGLAYAQTRKGQPVLVKADTGEVWFILRQSVTVKPKTFMADAAATVLADVPANLADAAARRIGGVQ